MSTVNQIFVTTLFVSTLIVTGCSHRPSIDLASYQKEITDWQIKRAEGLKKENGWLTLCGLFWLNEGENKFGTDSSNTIIFPPERSAAHAGSIFLEKGQLRFKCTKGVSIICNDSAVGELKIQSDESGKATPTIMKLGSLNFHIIKRGDRLGVRVKDNENPSRKNFKGLTYFPIELKWRLEAKFETYNPPKIIPIVNVLNQVNNDTCPGAIVFKIDGNKYRLDALKEGKELFIIFHDETAGKETYGMGRFLYTQLPDSTNNVVLDFNKAYNPPCAFTEFATCPLPPKQNYLPLRIEAGEKKYSNNRESEIEPRIGTGKIVTDTARYDVKNQRWIGVSESSIANATYFMPHDPDSYDTINLSLGSWNKEIVLETGYTEKYSVRLSEFALGDLNGNGKTDAAVTLYEWNGGSGIFVSLNALIDSIGPPRHVACRYIGDRIKIESVSIKNNIIFVKAIVQRYDQGVCCPDSTANWQFKLIGKNLEEITGATF